MAKAKEAGGADSAISAFVENFKGTIIENIKVNVIDNIRKKIKKLEKMALEIALSIVFFFIAIIFVLVALMFFLKEYFNFSYSLSFLCTGIIALIVAYAIYRVANKE